MSLTPEQLMIPRVMAIGTEPGTPNDTSRFWVSGQIIEFGRDNPNVWFNGVKFTFFDFAKYPHLFRSMPWWKARKLDEMPEYVKGPWGKVSKLTNDMIEAGGIVLEDYTPATEAEYNEYQNSKK